MKISRDRQPLHQQLQQQHHQLNPIVHVEYDEDGEDLAEDEDNNHDLEEEENGDYFDGGGGDNGAGPGGEGRRVPLLSEDDHLEQLQQHQLVASSSHARGRSQHHDAHHGFSDEEGDDLLLEAHMGSHMLHSRSDLHGRSRSLMRYDEIEQERSRRRMDSARQKPSKRSSCFPGKIKLTMINAGVIPLKRVEKDVLASEFYEKPVSLTDFEAHSMQRRKYPVLLQIEFNSAVRERETHSIRHGHHKRKNHERNQNPRIVPYDYNRVVLETTEGDDSDYINASYVDSLIQPKAYIVTQGPMENTIGDFWRMVWQERSACIVMVTRTFDFIRVMCVQYWPAGKLREEFYSGIGVTVENEEQLANFMIRTIRLRKGLEMRRIMLFHYTEWPCHSNPFSNALLEFRRRVRNVMNQQPEAQSGPVVVHCNDGAGRSGVYIAIDANIELSEEDGVFDVFGYLRKMRQQRRGLVESLDQYRFVYETLLEYTRGIASRFPVDELADKMKERSVKDKRLKKNGYQLEFMEQLKFIYDTLEEFLVCGYTFFAVKEISQHLKEKSAKVKIKTKGGKKTSEYEREYGLITNQTPRFSIGDCAAGHRADNRDKNRNVLIVPPDNFRPYITSFQGNNCTDYINAVFVDGYTHPREYIVTEWPLSNTCSDVWSLVYDHDCSAVVVLCNPTSTVSNAYPSFWPENMKSKKYGQVFTVEHMQHSHMQNIRSWVFKINKKIVSLTELMAGVKAPSKTCQLFQLMCWPQGHRVPTSTNALVELMNLVDKWRCQTEYGPVVVISQDGHSRAGVYCAANACIEQVVQHGEVDVFQAVKTVRRHRPQLVENITEYKYCYDVVLHYVLHYLHKERPADEED